MYDACTPLLPAHGTAQSIPYVDAAVMQPAEERQTPADIRNAKEECRTTIMTHAFMTHTNQEQAARICVSTVTQRWCGWQGANHKVSGSLATLEET